MTKQIPSPKSKTFGHWSLELDWTLVIGIWDFFILNFTLGIFERSRF